MALILCLETATDVCSVGLSMDGTLLALQESPQPMEHAARLSALISECLLEAQKRMADLQAVAVSRGPGSYTSLRIGYSTAKGIAYALDIPMLEINTLQALAAAARDATGRLDALYCPMLDARRMEVYFGLYTALGEELLAPRAAVLEPGMFDTHYHEGSTLVFTGNGAAKYDVIGQHPQAIFLPLSASASVFPALAERQFEEQVWADTAYCEPLYLKPPNITQATQKNPSRRSRGQYPFKRHKLI